MTFSLEIKDNIITKAQFETDGCVKSVITGAQTMKMIEKNPIRVFYQLTAADVLKNLIKFPPLSHHCCVLAVETLKRTLALYFSADSDMKKKLYG